MWIRKKHLLEKINNLIRGYEHHLEAERNRITAWDAQILKLSERIEKNKKEHEEALWYLEYTMNNPPKYKTGDKVKTFRVLERKYCKFDSVNGRSISGHGYQLRCEITDTKSDTYFSENELDAIKRRK